MATIARDQNRLTVETHAGVTYRELNHALRGRESPCRASPSNAWLSDNATERAEAMQACNFCPAILECREFARATRTEFRVWGGNDFTRP